MSKARQSSSRRALRRGNAISSQSMTGTTIKYRNHSSKSNQKANNTTTIIVKEVVYSVNKAGRLKGHLPIKFKGKPNTRTITVTEVIKNRRVSKFV